MEFVSINLPGTIGCCVFLFCLGVAQGYQAGKTYVLFAFLHLSNNWDDFGDSVKRSMKDDCAEYTMELENALKWRRVLSRFGFLLVLIALVLFNYKIAGLVLLVGLAGTAVGGIAYSLRDKEGYEFAHGYIRSHGLRYP